MRQGTFMSTKKHFLSVLPFLALIALLGSCLGTPHIFDDSLHDHEVASIIFIGGGINIVEYNGIPVRWNASVLQAAALKIPGGEATFVLDGTQYDRSRGWLVITRYDMIPFNFSFENGGQYVVYVLESQISVLSGTSLRHASHIATFNMRSGEQRLTRSFGESVAN